MSELPDGAKLTLAHPAFTLGYRVGMRLHVGNQSRRWRARLWRWLTKRNYRVAEVDRIEGTLTLRRSR